MRFKDKIILITGGIGFIGSCLTRYLNERGVRNIILVDRLGSTEKWRNLVGKNVVDVLDKSQLFSWLDGKQNQIETIVHLGACSTTVETDASYLLENNYRYSVKLADFALENQIPFIYASSAATYGDGSHGFVDNHDELEKLQPLNMYGLSKHLFDLWVKSHGVLDVVTGLKFFNVFGPNELHKGRMASAIVHMLPSARQNGVIRLFKSNDPANFADGGQMRDFVYIKDVVRMIYGFMQKRAKGIFNIGSGVPNTWQSLAQAMFNAIEMPTKIDYIAMPDDLHGKYQNYTAADMTKTRQVLGNIADCQSLEESVSDYVCNYLIPGKLW